MSSYVPAVFLSYASQDAEAARRICEALRAAGVEVWFDQSELRGGDQWDQSIRRQIRECTLFAPVISANTQTRGEGYFRLEWKLAADRSHLMARDQCFFLPVVIDDTPYGEARVPDEFHSVQWTHLPGGDSSTAFCERVKALLSVPPGTAHPMAAASRARGMQVGLGGGAPAGANPRAVAPTPIANGARARLVLALLGGAALVAVMLWQPWRQTAGGETALAAGANQRETRRLLAMACEYFQETDDAWREKFYMAEELLKRALVLDPSDGEVWAAYAELSADFYRLGYDRTPARLEQMRQQTERALQFAPDSVQTQLAQAATADYLGIDPAAMERKMRALAQRVPHNWRVLHVLGRNLGRAGKVDEAMKFLERADELARTNPAPLNDATSYLLAAGRYAEAEAAVAKSLARGQSSRALAWDLILKLCWFGDTAAATAALNRWPARYFNEDRSASLAGLVWLWKREPDKALAIYEKIPREYVRDLIFTGPRAVLRAMAHTQAGNRAAAEVDWALAIRAADRELAEDPESGPALYWKAWALAQRGEARAAEAIRQQVAERQWTPPSYYSPEAKLPGLALALANPDQAIALLEREVDAPAESARLFKNAFLTFPLTRAALELNPLFDPLRGDERFRRLIAKAPAPR